MKKNLLSVAIATAALAGFSQSSLALTPSTTPGLEIFMSGASAQDKGVNALVVDLCDAGTLHTYIDGTAGKKHQAWFCQMSPTSVEVTPGVFGKVAGLSATTNVLIHKRSDGGSAMGVSPLLDDTANGEIDHMVINNSNCTALGSAPSGFQLPAYSCNITGTGNLVKHRSDAGVSDVNPELFTGALNTPAGFDSVNKDEVAAELDVKPAAALVFGVPVSYNLYKALQTAQGLTDPACSAALTENSEACMPNLTKLQVASLLSGQVKDWSEFSVGGTALTSVSGVTAPSDTLVHICKRTAGSGTGAQMYAKFLNTPCTEGSLSVAAGDPFSGPVVHENLESSDLENCQDDLSNGTAASVDALTGEPINSVGNTAWAIGVQSLEKNAPNAATGAFTKAYRFVKIDGVAPSLKNAFNGSYMDWVELTWQTRKVAPGVPAGNTKAIIDTIIGNAGKPAKLASLLNKTHQFGKSGYLAIADTDGNLATGTNFTFTDTVNESSPVIPYTHAAGGKLNNCTVPARVSQDPSVVIPLK